MLGRVQDGSAQGVYVSTGVACAKDIQDGFAPWEKSANQSYIERSPPPVYLYTVQPRYPEFTFFSYVKKLYTAKPNL